MRKIFVTGVLVFLLHAVAMAQSNVDTVLDRAGLDECIRYALQHQPLIRQSAIDEEITETNIKSKLADWLPQVNVNYNLQHYLQLPTSFLPDANGVKRPVTTGVRNTSNIQLQVNQSIFNRDVLLATRTAADVRLQARQLTTSNKIDIVAEVSKAYYDLLLTQKQVDVLYENIRRLERSVQDSYNKYQGGIVDKIDYKRAQIALNNTRADRKKAVQAIEAKEAYLKQLMGYPYASTLNLAYDSLQMERDVFIDTLQRLDYRNRIEFSLLETQQSLLQSNLKYNKWSFLPSVSAFGNYTPTFQNDRFADLYGAAYPTSVIGLQVSFPLFQGGKRLQNIRGTNLQLMRLEWDKTNLNNVISTQYAQALAAYKGSLAERDALRENLLLAEDVYNTLRLQYNAGVKEYLDVIIAETDLRTAQLNYLNALYQALAGKLDFQKALGIIQY